MSSTTTRINPTQRARRQRLRPGEVGPGVAGATSGGSAWVAPTSPSPSPEAPSVILCRESQDTLTPFRSDGGAFPRSMRSGRCVTKESMHTGRAIDLGRPRLSNPGLCGGTQSFFVSSDPFLTRRFSMGSFDKLRH